MNIYVFKTSLNKRNVKFVKPVLDESFPDAKWNFDLEDCDRVLRIESNEDISDWVCKSIGELGFLCSELQDH